MPAQPLQIAKGTEDLYLLSKLTNSHWLVAGVSQAGRGIALVILGSLLGGTTRRTKNSRVSGGR